MDIIDIIDSEWKLWGDFGLTFSSENKVVWRELRLEVREWSLLFSRTSLSVGSSWLTVGEGSHTVHQNIVSDLQGIVNHPHPGFGHDGLISPNINISQSMTIKTLTTCGKFTFNLILRGQESCIDPYNLCSKLLAFMIKCSLPTTKRMKYWYLLLAFIYLLWDQLLSLSSLHSMIFCCPQSLRS